MPRFVCEFRGPAAASSGAPPGPRLPGADRQRKAWLNTPSRYSSRPPPRALAIPWWQDLPQGARVPARRQGDHRLTSGDANCRKGLNGEGLCSKPCSPVWLGPLLCPLSRHRRLPWLAQPPDPSSAPSISQVDIRGVARLVPIQSRYPVSPQVLRSVWPTGARKKPLFGDIRPSSRQGGQGL